MVESVHKDRKTQVAFALFLGFIVWWIFVVRTGQPGDASHQAFSATYGILSLWGGIWGLVISQKWGGYKSIVGRALLMFSLGLFAQEFGQIAYSYYAYYLHLEIPYPSIGDLGYFGSIPLYVYGALLLAKASGVKVSLQSASSKLWALLLPLLLLAGSYYIFLLNYTFDWTQPLKVFLDFGYPLGQAIYVSIALLTVVLSRNILGGVMRARVLFILFALFAQYLCDFTYLFQAQQGTAYPGGINDIMYLGSYFIMAVALFQFQAVLSSIQSK